MVMKYNDKLITELGAFFVDHGRYYGVDPVWHDHSKLVASDGTPDPALSADASGYLSAAVQPLFSAYKSSASLDVTGDNTVVTIIHDTEIYDRNSNYNSGTGIFTAPVNGYYLFIACTLVYDLGVAHTTGQQFITASNRGFSASIRNPYAASFSGYFSFLDVAIVDMDATDTCIVYVQVGGGAKTVDVYGAADIFQRTYFQGYLLI